MARVLDQGRGSGFVIFTCFFIASSLLRCSSATVYNVGGDSGWSIMTPFASWLQGKTFTVGDSLFFMYEQGWHDVTEVNNADYDDCNGVGSYINKWTEGNTTVKLEEPGERYFVCSFIGHCPPMKLAITVIGTTVITGASEPSASPIESHKEQVTTPPSTPLTTPPTTWSPPPKSTPPSWGPLPSTQAPSTWTPHHDAPSSWSPKPSSIPPPSWSPSPSWHPSTHAPSWSPSSTPTWSPPTSPSWSPSKSPHWSPTKAPSWSPTKAPAWSPSHAPSWSPNHAPSSWMGPTTWTPHPPTQGPSSWMGPTTWTHPPIEEPSSWISPTSHPPVEEPSSWISPTSYPPVEEPSSWISPTPSKTPIWSPTFAPSKAPTPTHSPTKAPAKSPTPSRSPIKAPIASPTKAPPTEEEIAPSPSTPISQSSSPHRYSPHFGTLFMTLVLAFFIMKV